MIKLLPVIPDDFPKLISWATSEEFLMQWTGRTFKYPLSTEQLAEYYDLSLGKKPSRLVLKAVDELNGKHIGNISIDWVKANKNEASLTCIIIGDNDYRGKGIGKFIVEQAGKIAFEKYGIRKLFLNVFDFNKSAIRCYENCGFKEVFREKFMINGKGYTNIRMELFL